MTTPSDSVSSPARERTLWRFALEGAASECVLWLTSGSALTAWSLALGGDAGTVSTVQSLATAAQAMHLPAALASSSTSRRRIVLVALGLARLAWLPLAFFAFSGGPTGLGRALLVAVAITSAVSAMFAQNALGAWIGDVVPAAARGRFFARRTWVGALGGSVAALVLAGLLDRGLFVAGLSRGRTSGPVEVPLPMLGVLALLVVSLGMVSVALLAPVHEPAHRPAPLDRSRAFALLRDPALLRFLAYQAAWGLSVGPGAAFFSMHILTGLEGGYRLIAAHGIVLVIARVLTARWWGLRVDRLGATRELALTSLGIGVMPLLWSACDRDTWWPLALDAVLSGVLWGGQAIAVSAHPLSIGDTRDRPFVLAWSSLVVGLAWALGALVAGALVRTLPSDVLGIGPLRVVFIASASGRAACAFLALRLDSRGRSIAASSASSSHS